MIEKNSHPKCSVVKEMRDSYLAYSMSVIVSRAIADARDGLKPVQRRILYSMYKTSSTFSSPSKKSARIVGDVISKYHPHGDTAVYDAITRLAQDFSINYPLICGQGNFGSIDGDKPASMRYTGVKMSRIADCLTTDIHEQIVSHIENYDNTLKMPSVLPASIPHLLLNGSTGIAVGLASNVLPHNLGELCDAIAAQIDNPQITIEELQDIVQGPDFPTGGEIYKTPGIKSYLASGKGEIVLRSKMSIDNNQSLVVTEIPYQVSKAGLVEEIDAFITHNKSLGLVKVLDESDRSGISIRILLQKNANVGYIKRMLRQHTRLEVVIHANHVALINDTPVTFGLKEYLQHFIEFRCSVVRKKFSYELGIHKDALHILRGFLIAHQHIGELVKIIRRSASSQEVHKVLQGHEYIRLSTEQISAILAMRLSRLTSLESAKIKDDAQRLEETIRKIEDLLSSNHNITQYVRLEILEKKEKHGLPRRTSILHGDIVRNQSNIMPEDMIVSMSRQGYIKVQKASLYAEHHRGAVGKQSGALKKGDNIKSALVVCATSTVLCYSSLGRIYSLPVSNILQGPLGTRGIPIDNFLSLQEEEEIIHLSPSCLEDNAVCIITKYGHIKKLNANLLKKIRANGLRVLNLREHDRVVQVLILQEQSDIMLFSSGGYAVRFDSEQIRHTGRNAMGVRGMRLLAKEYIVGATAAQNEYDVILFTEKGLAKRSSVSLYRKTNRGGRGVKSMRINARTGMVAHALSLAQDGQLTLFSKHGNVVKIQSSQINNTTRLTSGVKVMSIKSNDKLTIATQNEKQ